jgi:MYXO-CTERM domain-containing protein
MRAVIAIPAASAAFMLFLLAGWPAPAVAGTVTIFYQINGGSTVAPAGTVPISSGSFSVTFQAAGSYTRLTGPAVLNSFQVVGGKTYPIAPGASIQLTFSSLLLAPVSGTGTAGGVFANIGIAAISGPYNLHCFDTVVGACSGAGFAPSVVLSYPFTAVANAGQLNINAGTGPASGSLSAIYVSALGSGPFTTTFIGQEVSRSFVPEPASAPLAGLGLLALGGYAARRRVRRTSQGA